MAGDWIKMRIDLQSHPKVVRILSATKADKFRVIGGLHAAWSVFDTHSVDGCLRGYTPDALDHIIGWQGFSAAMLAVGWLDWDGAETLSLPEFDEHNGQSGKRRAEDQKRKRNARNCPQPVRKLSANDADSDRTREEKRREEQEQERQTPAAPVDFKAGLFARWKALPAGGGGAFLSKLLRDHKPEQRVLEAIEHTLDHEPADPKAFVIGVLRKEAAAESALEAIFAGAI